MLLFMITATVAGTRAHGEAEDPVLFFMITATAAGTRAHGEAEDPVLFLWVTSHGFAPGCRRCLL
jgi:hypothetical protein